MAARFSFFHQSRGEYTQISWCEIMVKANPIVDQMVRQHLSIESTRDQSLAVALMQGAWIGCVSGLCDARDLDSGSFTSLSAVRPR